MTGSARRSPCRPRPLAAVAATPAPLAVTVAVPSARARPRWHPRTTCPAPLPPCRRLPPRSRTARLIYTVVYSKMVLLRAFFVILFYFTHKVYRYQSTCSFLQRLQLLLPVFNRAKTKCRLSSSVLHVVGKVRESCQDGWKRSGTTPGQDSCHRDSSSFAD